MFVLLFKTDEKFPTDDGTMGGGDKTGTNIFLFTVHTCTMNGTLGHKYL